MKSLDQIYREMGIDCGDPPGYSHGLYIGNHSENFPQKTSTPLNEPDTISIDSLGRALVTVNNHNIIQ